MDLSKHGLTLTIKNEAQALGFNLVGVTSPDPPAHLHVYHTWIESGHHAEMAYLSNDRALLRRSNPREILPECQSILVVGMNYFLGSSVGQPSAPEFSTYAMGQDYHNILPQRLERLVSNISDLVGEAFPHRIYTDTGPLLERELAQRAGLGWIGKNSCLIHPQLGSFFFLGEVLLNFELDFDPPFATDHCGSCTRCIEACPTGCILPNRTLDARRCISYLTIEHKGSIPRELRPYIGEWIFGCDICQQVCPWNIRFTRATRDLSFQPISFLAQASLTDFLHISQDSFRESFRGSPFKRAKWHGILRNAIIVAGNRGSTRYIPELAELLLDNSEPVLRSHAAWALGCIGGEEVEKLLRSAKNGEEDQEVLEEILFAIEKIKRDFSSLRSSK